MDGQLHHPFTCIVAGPTGSGKSSWITKLISNAAKLVSPPIEKIIWCYSEWQPLYDQYKGKIEFHEGVPTENELAPIHVRKLIVIDDLTETANATVAQLFTRKSHHWNTSVIYVTQNLFDKNKYNRTISINAHYIVCFKNPRDSASIQYLARQMFCGHAPFMIEAYKNATRDAYGYLFIDARQETPDEYRLRTNIFPGETQFVYVQKNK